SAAAPGGDAEGALGKNLNPFKRKRDKPVVYWSGIVDVAGSREFSYAVPESFNGSLRVMAVAVSDDMAAAATAKTTVRGDLVLLPNVPVAITPGDEVEVGVGVANNAAGSGKEAPVTLALAVSPGLAVVGESQQVLKISERGEGTARFRIKARAGAEAQLGSASVVFTAQVGKEARARLSTDVSVRPASAYVTLVQTGLFRGSGEIAAQGNMYPNFQRSEAAVSASPWSFTAGLIQYLDVYPHGCTEQITSQTLPAVILSTQAGLAEELLKPARRASGADQAVNATVPDARKTLERYLVQVRARQGADGGIAMWPGGPADLFGTTYVVQLLVEARERKMAVPNDLLQRANLYLQGRLAQASRNDYDWRVQAQAAWLLTRQGIATGAALTNLREAQRQAILAARSESEKNAWRRDLGAAYLAAAYQIQKQDAVAEELLEPVFAHTVSSDDYLRNWYWNYYYDPLVRNAAVVYIVARHFPKKVKLLPEDYWQRLARAVREGWFQSLSASQVVLAVDAYANAAAQSAAGKIGVAAIDAKGAQQALDLPRQLILAKVAVPAGTAKLKLANQGDLPLFYSWAESGFERGVPGAAAGQGLEIVREFLDAKGNPVAEAQIGDELTVRLRVRATERQSIAQVAIADVLPGGLEPVLTAPSDADAPDEPLWRRRLGGKSTWRIDYADIREDRVVFYGNVGRDMTEVTYKVRATNAGDFVVPGAYGEAMYERRVFARSAGGSLKIRALGK
ncbi:MAG: hypothetical protein JNM82_15725, partial [Rhodocyclaceae bacterium]|nr:hypothetical protein [Rhodocyclaceae bacterium]